MLAYSARSSVTIDGSALIHLERRGVRTTLVQFLIVLLLLNGKYSEAQQGAFEHCVASLLRSSRAGETCGLPQRNTAAHSVYSVGRCVPETVMLDISPEEKLWPNGVTIYVVTFSQPRFSAGSFLVQKHSCLGGHCTTYQTHPER
ncbi:hypothetical protein LZ32DRAFT_607788 [Colletotrichum eremochloae]|uniref:Uncharacterized protein n=1 Tax=Colletotrichum sublineola TaxID=1173701 RepID=A0A066XLQ5_COLSU|nr:hypothetical protein LZ32DRAFT_607788 [Colletotrichum eremochloae]KDN69852.1 hypothetical protein CSUB01_01380 [Colletotrichum sublineola]